jgi:hypothetical protein
MDFVGKKPKIPSMPALNIYYMAQKFSCFSSGVLSKCPVIHRLLGCGLVAYTFFVPNICRVSGRTGRFNLGVLGQ